MWAGDVNLIGQCKKLKKAVGSESAAKSSFIKVINLGGFVAVRHKTPHFHQVTDTPSLLKPNSISITEASPETFLLLSDHALQF